MVFNWSRERLAATAGAIIMTVALPIAIDQGYFRHSVYALPSSGLAAAITYVCLFATSQSCESLFNKLNNGFALRHQALGLLVVEISIVAVLALLAGAFWVAVKKSAEHVAEIRKAEGNTTALATSPQRDEHVKQDITAIPGSNKPSVKTKAQAKHPAAAQQLDTEHLADELSKGIEGNKSTSAFKLKPSLIW